MSWPPGADPNPDLSEPHYVIIGAGFSALLNHLFLRNCNAARLGKLPILHIAEQSDPWGRYQAGLMGQWPCVLTLPGLAAGLGTPPNPLPEGFLSTSDFAAVSAAQWSALPKYYALHKRVTRIDQAAAGGFRIQFGDGTSLEAPFVDVCGGPGRSKRLDPKIVDVALWTGYESPRAAFEPLLTGEDFLARSPSAGGKVLVFGGSPTGAWCVENAEAAGCTTTWVSRASMREAFLPTRRNDGLAQPPLTRSMKNDRWVVDSDPVPMNPLTTFAEGYDLASVKAAHGGGLEVQFSAFGAAQKPAGLGSGKTLTFDQVVVAIGQLKRLAEPGSWAEILNPVLPPDVTGRSHVGHDAENRALWLEADDGALRVMGASALGHPEVEAEWGDPNSSSFLYFASLPQQLRVQVGVGLASLSVAAANGYFTRAAPLTNFNLASIRELRRMVGTAIHRDMAAEWFDTRRRRINPWTNEELSHLARIGRDRF